MFMKYGHICESDSYTCATNTHTHTYVGIHFSCACVLTKKCIFPHKKFVKNPNIAPRNLSNASSHIRSPLTWKRKKIVPFFLGSVSRKVTHVFSKRKKAKDLEY